MLSPGFSKWIGLKKLRWRETEENTQCIFFWPPNVHTWSGTIAHNYNSPHTHMYKHVYTYVYRWGLFWFHPALSLICLSHFLLLRGTREVHDFPISTLDSVCKVSQPVPDSPGGEPWASATKTQQTWEGQTAPTGAVVCFSHLVLVDDLGWEFFCPGFVTAFIPICFLSPLPQVLLGLMSPFLPAALLFFWRTWPVSWSQRQLFPLCNSEHYLVNYIVVCH